jgi:hypothetical protein
MIRVCPKCKSKNSLPTEGDPSKYGRPVCSKCRADLFPPIANSNGPKISPIDSYNELFEKLVNKIVRFLNAARTKSYNTVRNILRNDRLNRSQNLSNKVTYAKKWLNVNKTFVGYPVALALISSVVLLNYNPENNSSKPAVQTYQSLLEGVKPNNAKEHTCRKLLRKYGRRSHQINDDWYGKGVVRPHNSGWSLRIKKPSLLFGGDLFYVFENETEDGFQHSAYCQFSTGDYDYYEFKVAHFEREARVMCSSDAAAEGDTC